MKKREDLNLYEKKITLGRDASGKPVRKSIYAKTKAELEKKIFDARQEWLQTAPKIEGEQITFVAYCKRWLDTEKAGLAITTRRLYAMLIHKHIEPSFSGVFFSEITQDDLIDFIIKRHDRPGTARHLRGLLVQIINSAEDRAVIAPGKLKPGKLPLPTIKKKQKRRPLTDDEKDALFTADLTDRERSFVLMLYFTGLRREEALALTNEAIDLKNKSVTVKQVRVMATHSKAEIIPTAKSATSLRTVPLPDRYINLCSDYIKSRKGIVWTQKQQEGKVITDSAFQGFWKSIILKLSQVCPSCSELTPHMFRHNYATMLYYSNISIKMAAKLLGHSDITMIMKIYAHLDEEKENAAEKLNAMFSGS